LNHLKNLDLNFSSAFWWEWENENHFVIRTS
jgi:hypothetical protein